MNAKKLIFILVVGGCLAGLYAYKVSGIKQQETKRTQESFQMKVENEKRQREKEEEERLANDASVQVSTWYTEYKKIVNFYDEEELSGFMKKNLAEVKEKFRFWKEKREEELIQERNLAETNGNAERVEECNRRLESLAEMSDEVLGH